jgi:hypothetical protein
MSLSGSAKFAPCNAFFRLPHMAVRRSHLPFINTAVTAARTWFLVGKLIRATRLLEPPRSGSGSRMILTSRLDYALH